MISWLLSLYFRNPARTTLITLGPPVTIDYRAHKR